MFSIFLFLAIAFLFTLLAGRLVEKIRVPWIFAALLFGTLLAINNPFKSVTDSDTFSFLAKLGMYFLLFGIGLEIDLKEVRKRGRFIVKATFFIIFLEAIFGTILFYYLFNAPLMIAFLIALSFATIGEAVLIPILEELKVVNTDLGILLIGIGTLDDVIEVATLLIVIALISPSAHAGINTGLVLASLFLLIALTFGFSKFGKNTKRLSFDIDALFLLMIASLFLFIGIGEYAESAPLAALLAGIGLKTFIPKGRFQLIEREIKVMTYGLFAPIFFMSVGATMDINYVITYPLLILATVAVCGGAKLLGSYIVAKNELGRKKSILLGIGLSTTFSTSIVVIKLLFDNGVIGAGPYSVIIASAIVFKFIIPPLFANLLVRWKVTQKVAE